MLFLSLGLCYLVGAIPFGWLIARAKGVDLFTSGSGNIGATNVGRILGRPYGVAVFLLDFLKGAAPVAGIVPFHQYLEPEGKIAPELLATLASAAAFLGHLFPVWLGFRGGKGVATGAGTVAVLVPVPALAAVGTWLLVALLRRQVSLASLLAVVALSLTRIAEPGVFEGSRFWVTLFCLVGTLLVVVKHRANVARLLSGTENTFEDGPMRQHLLRALHIIALGLWVGGAGFFNFVAAPTIFASFTEVVEQGASDRTANQTIIDPHADATTKKALASALAGSAVGPIFPKFYLFQILCGAAALATASCYRKFPYGRLRLLLLAVALTSVVAGKVVSDEVTRLRLERFSPDSVLAEKAKTDFASWHLVSLALSFVTLATAFPALGLAARLPTEET